MDNKNIRKILNKIVNKNVITYGENQKADYQLKNIEYNFERTKFDLIFKGKIKNKFIKNININY